MSSKPLDRETLQAASDKVRELVNHAKGEGAKIALIIAADMLLDLASTAALTSSAEPGPVECQHEVKSDRDGMPARTCCKCGFDFFAQSQPSPAPPDYSALHAAKLAEIQAKNPGVAEWKLAEAGEPPYPQPSPAPTPGVEPDWDYAPYWLVALRACDEALAKHNLWCGYRRGSPGDPSFNRAERLIRDAIRRADYDYRAGKRDTP